MAKVTLDANPVDAVIRAAEANDPAWYEAALSAGITAREAIDQGRYDIGDLADVVAQKRYGADAIGKYAAGIGVGKERAEEYRTVCRFYPRSTRANLLDLPCITYSHLRLAMRLQYYSSAVRFLVMCSDKRWKFEAAAVALKKILKGDPDLDEDGAPRLHSRLFESYGTIIRIGDGKVEVDIGAVQVERLTAGQRVRVAIYESDEEGAEQ